MGPATLYASLAATSCIQARTLWGGLINNCRNVVRRNMRATPSSPAPPTPLPLAYQIGPHAPCPTLRCARCGSATLSSPTTPSTRGSSGGNTCTRGCSLQDIRLHSLICTILSRMGFCSLAAFDTYGYRMAAETKAFSMALRNFLRGPEDDGKLRAELYELAESGIISQQQVDIPG